MPFDKFLQLVGRNIAQQRRKLALNQRDAAEKSAISYRYFQSIEAGSANLTLSTLFRLSQLLKVPVSELVKTEQKGA